MAAKRDWMMGSNCWRWSTRRAISRLKGVAINAVCGATQKRSALRFLKHFQPKGRETGEEENRAAKARAAKARAAKARADLQRSQARGGREKNAKLGADTLIRLLGRKAGADIQTR